MKDLKFSWISIILLVSLGLNFFALGYLYSEYQGKKIKMTRLYFDKSISSLYEPFPRAWHRQFWPIMKGKRSELIPIYNDIMAQRRVIVEVIAENPFNREKLNDAMAKYNGLYGALRLETQVVMTDVLEKLSPEDRQKILTEYTEHRKHKYRRDSHSRNGYSRDSRTNKNWSNKNRDGDRGNNSWD